MNHLSQKVISSYIKTDPVITGFIPNEVKGHLQIYDHSIVTFGIRGLYLGFSNTSHVDSLYRFRKSVVDKVKFDIRLFNNNHSKS